MKADAIASLRQKLHRPVFDRLPAGESVSTGIPALDRLLPDGGLRGGMLLELLAAGRGSGAATLAVRMAAGFQQQRETLIVDRTQSFSPPAITRLGMSLPRTVIVRPAGEADAIWSLEQSLRCRGVGVVIGQLGRMRDVVLRRLQLAAETGGTVGILLRPADCAGQTCWADVRWRISPRASPEKSQGAEITRRIDVELLQSRGRLFEGQAMLEFNDETGDVREVPQLAGAAEASRRAGA